MAQVFISYSRKDLAFVEQLAEDLKNAGLDVWYDISGLVGGARWRFEIEGALRNSQFVVVVLSPDSITSEWVEREFLFASNLNLKIVPLMYRSCDLSLSYVNMNYIDVRGNKYFRNFSELLKGLSVDATDIHSLPKRKIPYVFLISSVAIITIILVGLPTIKNVIFPIFTPTSLATATLTIEAPTDTPAPIPTAISTWQQGKLAYVARNSEKVYFLYTQVLDASSEQPQLLLSPDNPAASRYYAPWFSPNGQQLVFSDLYTGKIFIMDVITKDVPKFIGNCNSPSFAPDGIRVVCDSNGADYFRVYDVETGNNVGTISHGKSGSVLPAWSPEGNEIAFSVFGNDRTTTIWKTNVDGDVLTPLASGATENYAPSWSPDGEWIAYQSTQTSDKSEVWIMRPDGSDKKQITFSGGRENWSRGPCFSPDGKWLAFVSNQNETDGSDFGEVFVVSLITGEVHQITHMGGYVLDWRVTWTN